MYRNIERHRIDHAVSGECEHVVGTKLGDQQVQRWVLRLYLVAVLFQGATNRLAITWLHTDDHVVRRRSAGERARQCSVNRRRQLVRRQRARRQQPHRTRGDEAENPSCSHGSELSNSLAALARCSKACELNELASRRFSWRPRALGSCSRMAQRGWPGLHAVHGMLRDRALLGLRVMSCHEPDRVAHWLMAPEGECL